MAKRYGGALLALTMGWVCALSPRSEARPPDLPVNPQVTCPEGRETDGRFPGSAEVVDHLPGAAPIIPDLSWMELLLPSVFTKASCETPSCKSSSSEGRNGESNHNVVLDRFRQAQRIFELGLQYERQGLAGKARTCYQEAHLISPQSRFGRLAVDRLLGLESTLRHHASTEEAEEPADGGTVSTNGRLNEQNRKHLIRETLPLGTIPVESY